VTTLTEVRIDARRIKPSVVEEVEAKLGHPIGDLQKPGTYQGPLLHALAYAVGRRIDHTLSWEEAGELDVEVVNVPVPPTNGDGFASTGR
jgi:hypothetical protein